jgi:Carbohydrate binding module (family 6)/Secretion system C-terminal sorting domain
LGFPHPIASIVVSSSATYVILTDSTIWAWGDNVTGAIGNGQELDFSKYTTGPSPTGGTPAPYNWDWAMGELLQQKPVQIANGLHSFTNIWATGNDVFYCYAEDVNGQLYSWGRGKGGVLGNAVMAGGSGGIAALYPNSWDVPWVTAVNPFGLAKILPSTSPYCVLNPSGSPCNGYTNPVSAAPAVSAGPSQNITGTTAALSGTATANNASIMSYLWNQVSGPNTPQITLNTGAVAQLTGLITGTYIFQLKATDNNWRSNSSTVTIVVGLKQYITVNAGTNQTITMPSSSISLAGTAVGNNGASISSTAWTQTSGPNTASILTPSVLSTSVTGMITGTYTFKLSANATGLDTSTTVTATVNPVPFGYSPVPGLIQAESYASMFGVQTETTIDAGGGLDVGWIDQGNWMKYNVNVAAAGTYTVGFRIASPLSGGTLQLKNTAGTVLTTVNVPTTGNWEAWQTVTATITLPAGNQTLQVYNNGVADWNINWINFANFVTGQQAVTDVQAVAKSGDLPGSTTPSLTLYPNPAHDNLTLNIDNDHMGKMTVRVINGAGQTMKTFELSKDGQSSLTNLNVAGLPAGVYFIRIQIGEWIEVKKLMKL